jgi:hypothetical protein
MAGTTSGLMSALLFFARNDWTVQVLQSARFTTVTLDSLLVCFNYG